MDAEGRLPQFEEDELEEQQQQKQKQPVRKCVDLFLWLRIVVATYRVEQANRRASVRLMFETAVSAVLVVHEPVYGLHAVGDEDEEEGSTATGGTAGTDRTHLSKGDAVSLPQFLSIVRTLWPTIPPTEAATCYREASEMSVNDEKKVNFASFLAMAERRRFFSRSLLLPCFLSALGPNTYGTRSSAAINQYHHI